jgi:hypothetical protein
MGIPVSIERDTRRVPFASPPPVPNQHPQLRAVPTSAVAESLTADVVHALAPDDLDDADLQPALRDLADGRHVLVCRKGGKPSWRERVAAFLRRDPIEAVTVVADDPIPEGEEFTATVTETDIAGVYELDARR